MLLIRSSADMARALAFGLEPLLHNLLAERRSQLLRDLPGTDLSELAHFIVALPSDPIHLIEQVAGIPLATNLIDGSRLGEPDFTPSFEFVERHSGWIEAGLILNDDGFALVLLVPDVDCDLRRLVTA
ncbi:hypothetical protein [Sphingomonas yantingensis]|uniref:Uncharacterized protein n=1 Tax=Sphingomonas yantingensis TaxID=1241761 RepID=A0A7W9EJE3_9SPHN|nr:hypothetical protein [Sphingomonas yantingensis]MBB5698506.1 hypothetical protein [Sphingomonas yantingensis]